MVAPSDREVDARIHAGLQAEIRVRDFDLDLRRACGRIEDGRDIGDTSGELLARERIHLDTGLEAHRNAPQVLFDNVRDDAHAGDVDDREKHGIRRDPCALIERPFADEAIQEFAKRERGWRKRLGAKPARGAFKSKPVGLSYRGRA